jgi:hypothetical protein
MEATAKESNKNEPTDPILNPDEKTKIKHSKEQFENVIEQYLASNPILKRENKVNELEIRFGSNPKLSKPISKIDYDNVVKQLLSCGFHPEIEDGIQILRIQNEFIDPRSGITKMSNIRAEIVGTDLIQEYCRTNSLQRILDLPSNLMNKLKFTQKLSPTNKDGSFIKPVDMADFNFRVSYKLEQDFNVNTNIARNIISNWNDQKKTFRCMNRTRFYHPEFPIFGDLSIIKSSKKTNYVPIPKYTIQDADVFNNGETYEIELEIDNARVGTGTKYNTKDALMDVLRKMIRIVLCGLQCTKYPISYSERDKILQEYMVLIHGEKYVPRRITSNDFMGPSSNALQLENVIPVNETSNVGNIRKNYAVTDKADGDRKLLFIAKNGNMYMIDTNMNVSFTGMYTPETKIRNTLIDGEHIKYDKNREFINLYAAFDIYYINKRSYREFAFIPTTFAITTSDNKSEDKTKYRLQLLEIVIDGLKAVPVLEGKHQTDFTIKCKSFYPCTDNTSIFECCSIILSRVDDGTFEYNTDGLIFTPTDTGVGGKRVGETGPSHKFTWDASFKWKPVEYNTIDFLVALKKDKTTGEPEKIHNIFEEGKNLQGTQELKQYRTLELKCGYDVSKHGYLNPFQDMIDGKAKTSTDMDNEERYHPVRFQSTNPYDPHAGYTNVLLKKNGNSMNMITEEGEYFEADTIVEFKYVMNNSDGWKWVPLRVRYDKTSDLKNGAKQFGNAYHVANSNWHSLHHPVTKDMITKGEGIPETDDVANDDVYYNRNNKDTNTQGLRDFHNLYVKKKLVVNVANTGDKLIDYAVGKAGDLSKWINAKLSFVYGIDVAKNNIMDGMDGACARYLNTKKKNKSMFDAIFMHGNSSQNIRNGNAFMSSKEKQINNAIFGTGPKDAELLGKAVYKNYGVGQEGFNISSCQFALHYFFENKTSLHEFLRNVAECTRINGYFIGTCYDGASVFNLLKNKKKDENYTIMSGDKKIFEITKLYDETGFPEDDMSLGYPINVYQESINKVFREYLVNFNYLVRLMENFGFTLITKTEANHMSLPDGSALFSQLYENLKYEIKRSPNTASDYGEAINMTEYERKISFLNRYFIFRKTHSVNMEKITKVLDKQDEIVEKIENQVITEIEKEMESEKKEEEKKTLKARKTKKSRIVLNKYEVIPEADDKKITYKESDERDSKKESEEKPKIEPLHTGEKKKIVIKKPKIVISDDKK